MAPDPTSPGEYMRDENAEVALESAGVMNFSRHSGHEIRDLELSVEGHMSDLRSDDPNKNANRPSAPKRDGWVIQMLRVFITNRMAVIFIILLIGISAFAFLGPVFYHTNQTDASAFLGLHCNQPPSAAHLLGTNGQCFDMLGRLMVGGQASLTIGTLAAVMSMLVGIIYGMFSGYRGGLLDSFLMRILDVLLSIPGLYLILMAVVLFGQHRLNLVLILAFTGWYGVARILRAEAIILREREFAQAVRSMGGSSRRIVWRHIIPNSISTTVTLGTFAMADSILSLAALGFLGVGLVTPDTDWGTILNSSIASIVDGLWWEIWPVVVLFLIVVMSFNYIGDALRDAFEVRLRDRG